MEDAKGLGVQQYFLSLPYVARSESICQVISQKSSAITGFAAHRSSHLERERIIDQMASGGSILRMDSFSWRNNRKPSHGIPHTFHFGTSVKLRGHF